MDFPDHTSDYDSPRPQPVIRQPQPVARRAAKGQSVSDGHRYIYTVDKYSEGAIGTILLGASSFNPSKLSAIINKRAGAGYRMVFQIKEQRRLLLFWKRESIIITFEKAIS